MKGIQIRNILLHIDYVCFSYIGYCNILFYNLIYWLITKIRMQIDEL